MSWNNDDSKRRDILFPGILSQLSRVTSAFADVVR